MDFYLHDILHEQKTDSKMMTTMIDWLVVQAVAVVAIIMMMMIMDGCHAPFRGENFADWYRVG